VVTVDDVQTAHAEPRISVPLVDEAGFAVDVWAEHEIELAEARALATPAEILSGVSLTRSPYAARALVTVDEDALWVSVEVVGEGQYTSDVEKFARLWFADLWDAVQLGAHPDAAGLQSAPQLLALARANRNMDWDSAVVWAGFTSPREASHG